MTDGISVRVGIVSWNTAGLLDRCLGALPAALSRYPAEIVVVDNASDDGSGAVALSHPRVTLIQNDTNEGYARAMNQALAGSTAAVLIALNPDTEPPPGSLDILVEDLLSDPAVALVAPRLVNLDGSLQHSVYRFPSPAVAAAVSFVPQRWQHGGIGPRFWLEGSSPHGQTADIDWAIGAVHVIRAEALGGRKPYDERWFMYVEDLEICWRLAAGGWRRRFLAEVSVPHVGNAAGAQAWGEGRTRRWLMATYDWYQRDRGRTAVRVWALVNTLGVMFRIVVLVVGGVLRRSRSSLREAQVLVRLLPVHAGVLVSGAQVPCDSRTS
ncbi:MAG: glycosyltransferase [Acidimicrobiales bacterium]